MSCRTIAITAVLIGCFAQADGADWMIEFDLRGRHVEGKVLGYTATNVLLLARDGYVWEFSADEPKNFRKTSPAFRGYSHSEIRRALLDEFGRRFEVSGAGNYLVVHPAGQRDQWAARFDELYRAFQHYFSARGTRPDEPAFPLVAIVFPNRTEFLKHAAQTGVTVQSGVVGFYSFKSNRILMYDQTAGRPEADWQLNAETVIHEATHQTAFNTGIHSRFADQPRWIVEGLGVMFEARGVWNSRRWTRRSDRVHQGWLAQFREYAASTRRKGSLAELISSDRIFQTEPLAAYAESWALTFYLAETQPKKYFDYLRKTAARKPFSEYRGPERLADFTAAFGSDLAMLDARLLRFLADLD